jgi:hypothetical protein
MIRCTVCSAENDDFALICLQCKGFLQNRVPNLDFFATSWEILESPRKAFHRITLAEHKNYSFALFSSLGICLAFTTFWYYRLGERFDSLVELIAKGLLFGVVAGIVLALLIPTAHWGVTKTLGGTSSFRSSLGVTAYALIPVTLSLALILPIELATFGMYLFTSNPQPYTIKPLSYVILVGFDSALGLWAVLLAVFGTMVSQRLSAVRSAVSVFLVLLVTAGLVWLAASKTVVYL